MTADELIPDTILIGEKLYADAIKLVLSQAQQSLLIFDQDLSRGDFASVQTYDLLNAFLSKDSLSQLTIILQSTAYFEQSCPRLFQLLGIYGHKMAVFETNQTAKHAKDCFILADGLHFVKRIHIDQARFKYALDDAASVEILNSRFDELKEATNHPLAVTKLGL